MNNTTNSTVMCKYYHLNLICILIYYTNKPGVGGLHFFIFKYRLFSLEIFKYIFCYMIWKKISTRS